MVESIGGMSTLFQSMSGIEFKILLRQREQTP